MRQHRWPLWPIRLEVGPVLAPKIYCRCSQLSYISACHSSSALQRTSQPSKTTSGAKTELCGCQCHSWYRVGLLGKTAFEMPQQRVHLWQEPFEETNVKRPARGGVAHI